MARQAAAHEMASSWNTMYCGSWREMAGISDRRILSLSGVCGWNASIGYMAYKSQLRNGGWPAGSAAKKYLAEMAMAAQMASKTNCGGGVARGAAEGLVCGLMMASWLWLRQAVPRPRNRVPLCMKPPLKYVTLLILFQKLAEIEMRSPIYGPLFWLWWWLFVRCYDEKAGRSYELCTLSNKQCLQIGGIMTDTSALSLKAGL